MNGKLVAWLAPLALAHNLFAFDSIVVFNEIQYHPAADDSTLEFIELYNQNTVDVDLSGWRISSGIDFAFPEGTVIRGQGYLVVAASPAVLEAAAGITGALGPYQGKIENMGDVLRLRNRNDRIMDEIEFNDRYPWPVEPDGSGASLSKLRPSTAGDQADYWRASIQSGGTPGARNFPESGSGPATSATRVIELGGTWRFNESGADLGANWASSAHAPGGNWKIGTGILAYESPAPAEIGATLTQPSLNTPFVITYYFETEFVLTQAEFDRLHAIAFTHRIDDGAIFYLNGAEVLRDNMPSGNVTASTTAAGSGDFTVEGPFEIPLGSLQVGSNRISVEVHQGGAGSSDVVFGLEVDLLRLLPGPGAPADLVINEVAPASDPAWWLEIANSGSEPIDLADHVLATTGIPANEYVFPAHTIQPGGFQVITAETLGFAPPSNTRLFLYGPNKASVIDGVDLKNRLQARAPGHPDEEFLSPSAPSPGAPNPFSFHDGIVISEIMYHHRPEYPQVGLPPSIQPVGIFGYDQVWRYNETGNDLGGAWAGTPHPAGGAWKTGAGPLGWETASAVLPAPLATILSRPAFNSPFVITHYFETDFTLSAAELANTSQLEITHMVDDGAVFYLNGQEIGRFAMPPGGINASTLSMSGGEAVETTFTTVPQFLIEGTNRISVEVHQEFSGSSDIVMGLRLASLREIPSANPPVEYADNSEEWIELHNRSANVVDLSGWSFDQGVGFAFPTGTLLPSGGYLVVANDAAALATKVPGITIAGNFSGSLSNSGERLRLVDAAGNPADEVFYHDGAPWPEFTDAGGSSLELRDPDADNSVAGAWSASDNSGDSEWTFYTVTLTAQNPIYRPGQFNFHELRMGLLDAGDLLLDDVSVVENPGGTNRELVQNGNFNDGAAGWRLLGTHEESEVIADGGNPVLRVFATGEMNYMNNLLETNLRSTPNGPLVPVQVGTEYRISFRAKWLGGTPQFRVELYYNKVAATLNLKQPATGGTPGMPNSVVAPNIGPTFDAVAHGPAVPPVNTPISVTGRISDPDGVASAQLRYAISGAAFQTAPMAETSVPGVWSGQIPGQSSGTKIQFYIEASDAAAAPVVATFPAKAADSRAMIQVADGRHSNVRQNIRIIMTNADSSALHNANDLLQNRRLGCTVITNETDIAYDCGIRLRGSMFSRQSAGGTGLNIKFPADRPFRGIHGTITTRTSGRIEILAKHMVNHAGGIHDDYNDVAQLIHSTQNGPTRLSMARYGQPYLRGLAGGRGTDGTVFKMEGIREFQSTIDGNPESQKAPFPIGWISSFDIADQGDDKEIYRHNIRINNNLAKDDYTSIIAMCKAFSLSGQALEDAIPQTINVDMWMRQFAILSLLGVGDTYTQGNPHNLNMYVRPEDGLVEPMPWDWDFLFNLGATSSLWGNRNFSKIPARPVFTRLFHGHLQDLINTTFNTGYMTPWLSHYSDLMGEGYTGRATDIQNRVNYVTGQLPAQIPFAITTNGGGNFSVDIPTVTLGGNAWINVRQIRINGSPTAITPDWSDADSWVLNLPVAPGANAITLTAIDYQGNAVGNDTITVTNTSTIAPADASNLVISEIHYHPAGDAAEEFVELQNIHPSVTIDLTGLAFVEGISFGFPVGTKIAPGARLLLVQDAAAFHSKFGASPPVIGVFANQTRLANSGERLRLEATGGLVVRDFSYGDGSPWPESPDGNGPSLVLIAPNANPDHSLPGNWRPSIAPGGNPGASDATTFPGGDLLDYALADPPSASIDASGHALFSFTRHLAADDVICAVEFSLDLDSWSTDPTVISLSSMDDHGNGTATITYRTTAPLSSTQQWFMRLRTTER